MTPIENCLTPTSSRRSSGAPPVMFIHTGDLTSGGVNGVRDLKLAIPKGSHNLILVAASAFEQIAIAFHPIPLNVTPLFGAGAYSGNEEYLPFGPASILGQPGGAQWNGQLTRGYYFDEELPSEVFVYISNGTGWTRFAATFVVNGVAKIWS